MVCLVVDKSKLQNEPLGVILTARFLAHFEVYLDVKKETFDEKYSDDDNEKKLVTARHTPKLTVDGLG